ncbi:MAG: DNA circularization N-terminal domain-containing protein, partial [Oscillospiraceae bacterium]|nr:DNA circularization N-terminal domain-containing protein [Oscillospiraceae bacterium]
MRYKGYVWPHNPATYSIDFARDVAALKAAGGGCCLQDMGMRYRVMRGEGEFVGEGAYDEFKRLATVFYEGGAGQLIHPVWQTANAYFTALRLVQRPLVDYVQYSFEFREAQGYFEEGLKTLWHPQEDGGSADAENETQVVEAVYHT